MLPVDKSPETPTDVTVLVSVLVSTHGTFTTACPAEFN